MALSLPRSPRFSRPSRRALLAPALLAAGLAAAAVGPGPEAAHAAAGISCDPIVVLSNGRTAQLTAAVAVSSASTIGTINWQLHAPSGTSVVSVTYNDNVSSHENFNFFADQAAGSYKGTVVVNLVSGSASVTSTDYAFLTSDTLGNLSPDTTSGSATGKSGQTLSATFQHA